MPAEALHAILGGEALRLADVGASYFLPDTWMALLPLPAAKFVLFDPNGKNLSYAQQMPADRVTVIPAALSREGGVSEFFLANVDSGSSLMPPHPWPGRPALNHDYFFPLRVLDIETRTLASCLDEHRVDAVHALKLDTQGSELDIVKGLDRRRLDQLLLVEMEVTMDSQPVYIGAARLPEVIDFFEQNGFRYLNTRVMRKSLEDVGCVGPKWSATLAAQHECDVVFVKDVLNAKVDPDAMMTMLRRTVTLLCAYYLHADAIETLRLAAPALRGHGDALAEIERQVGVCAERQAARLKAGAFTTWHQHQG